LLLICRKWLAAVVIPVAEKVLLLNPLWDVGMLIVGAGKEGWIKRKRLTTKSEYMLVD